MSNFQGKTPRRALALITLAVLMGVVGAALYAEGYRTHDSAMRQAGSWAIVIGALLAARASAVRARARRARSTDGGERPVPTAARRSNRIIRIIGIGFVLLGIALFAAGSFAHNWTPRVYGLLAAFGGVLFARASFDRVPSPGTDSGEEAVPKAVRRFDRVTRIIGIGLVPLMAFSAVALYHSAATGYHEVWPVYTSFVIAVMCALVWAYLLARLIVRLVVGSR